MVTRNYAISLSQIARLTKHRKPACPKYEFAILRFHFSIKKWNSLLFYFMQQYPTFLSKNWTKNFQKPTNYHEQPRTTSKIIKEQIIFLSIKMMVVVRGSPWQFVDFSRFSIILQCFGGHQIVLSTLSEIILTSEL